MGPSDERRRTTADDGPSDRPSDRRRRKRRRGGWDGKATTTGGRTDERTTPYDDGRIVFTNSSYFEDFLERVPGKSSKSVLNCHLVVVWVPITIVKVFFVFEGRFGRQSLG